MQAEPDFFPLAREIAISVGNLTAWRRVAKILEGYHINKK